MTRLVVERGLHVPMRDGVVLRADVYRPDSGGPFPVLLERTPYDRTARGRPGVLLDALRYAESGYAVVIQDTRGRFASDGDFFPFRHERADGVDTIAWAAALPYSSGRVATFGASYAGATQWLPAAEVPPALTAMVTARTCASYYSPWVYQGGVFQLGFVLHWALSSLAPDTSRRLVAAGRASADLGRLIVPSIERWKELACQQPLVGSGRLAEYLAIAAPFVHEWLEHPAQDAYWRQLDAEAQLDRISIPAVHIGGWYDIFLQGTLRAFVGLHRRHPGHHQLVVGPWAHGPMNDTVGEIGYGVTASGEGSGLGRVMEQFLRETTRSEVTTVISSGSSSAGSAPVRLFVMGANAWRNEREWPLARAESRRWYLRAGGRLDPAPPGTEDESPDTYTYDPRDPVPTCGGATLMEGHAVNLNAGPKDQRMLEKRRDVLVYSSHALEQPLEVTGPLVFELYASTSTPDTDWVVKLMDVHPDGSAILVSDGILRARYREGFDRVVFLESGRTYRFDIEMQPTSNLFLRGHRIRVHISSSNFPRFAPNPNTGVANPYLDPTEPQVAHQTIYHDRRHPSAIVLPVVAASTPGG